MRALTVLLQAGAILLVGCGSGSSGGGASSSCSEPSKGALVISNIVTSTGEDPPVALGEYGCTQGHRELGSTTRFVEFNRGSSQPGGMTIQLANNSYTTGVLSVDPYGLIDPGRYRLTLSGDGIGFDPDDTKTTGTFETTRDGEKAQLEGAFTDLKLFGCTDCPLEWVEITGSFSAAPYD